MGRKANAYLLDDTLSDKERIETFINGYDSQERIYAIESIYGQNKVNLFIDDPENGKRVETHLYTPFAFIKNFKDEGKQLYTPSESSRLMKLHGLSVIPLRTDKNPRLEAGFKYIMETSKSTDDITKFFTKAGINPYKSDLITQLKPEEQFLISTGKRLFKGYEKYSDVHKLYFDIETTSLEASRGRIFMIGIKDNRGFQKVLSIDKNNPDDTEREIIEELFNIIVDLKPAIVAGYNSENFDFNFIFERAEILGIMQYDDRGRPDFNFKTSIHPNGDHPIKRKKSTVKFGGETEEYQQTLMWGINVMDICHAVRKAQAINSEIKRWSLKYITQFADKAKPNRMYVPGDNIYAIWEKNRNYLINTKNSNYKIIPDEYQNKSNEYLDKIKLLIIKNKDTTAVNKNQHIINFFDNDADNVMLITGIEIINQYLLDDLWETEQVDEVYNQASYMMAANIPTNYVRVSTMGSATTWKLLMTAYSYEAKIAIPKAMKKQDIVGGLSRLFNVGYVENILKMDFASLYPSIQLTHDVFPTCDITGVFKKLLNYFRDARLYYKDLAGKAKKSGDKDLETLADTKQLPIKIFINTLFGGLSSPEIFPWGDNLVGERITCTGRQYLRQMAYFFISKGFKPLLGDTDGINYGIPENVGALKYTNKKGDEFTGYKAVLEEYNETYMHGAMLLDEDGLSLKTINFSRKNYVNMSMDKKKNKPKIKLTGASIKSKKIPTYIEEFIDEGLKYLLDNNGKDFIDLYHRFVEDIYNGDIPLRKIAQKARIKMSVSEYKGKALLTNKNGGLLPKQAHMELVIKEGININLGDTIYYINNGAKKLDGDVGNSYLIFEKDFIANPDLKGEYNILRSIAVFNKKVEPLLVGFNPEIRGKILITNPKDKEKFTVNELKLVSGYPLKVMDQDCINIDEYISPAVSKDCHKNEPLFEMSEREIIFWNKVGIDPKEIFPDFTTELSETKLNVTNVKFKVDKILNYFKNEGIDLKWMLERYTIDDLVLTYDYDTDKWFVSQSIKGDLVEQEEIQIENILSI